MTDYTIERDVLIDAPADVVWRTITEPDQIAHWFADRVEVDLRPGGTGTFGFEDRATAAAATAVILVDTVDPPRRFSFRWGRVDGQAPAPGDSVLVELTLAAEGDEQTRLRVVETGLDGVRWPDEEKARYVDDHRHGWATHLGRLEALFAPAAG
jgi:uncharacterized protein YndB with AHSA1/START domain